MPLRSATFTSGVSASSFTLAAAIPNLSVSSVSSVRGGDTSATLTLAFSGDFGTPATLGVTVRAAVRSGSTDLTTGKRVRVAPTDTAPSLGSTNANRAHTGAEMDLIVHVGGGLRGFEVKRTSAPRVTRSMRTALEDLPLDRVDVIHAGSETFPLGQRIRAVAASRVPDDLRRPPVRGVGGGRAGRKVCRNRREHRGDAAMTPTRTTGRPDARTARSDGPRSGE